MLPKKQPNVNVSNYSAIVQSSYFKQLMEKKKRFIVPMTLFFFVFYFSLPILTAYTDVLNNPAIGSITWAWIFAFAQFIMTWSLCVLYTKKAKTFDELADQVIAEMDKEASS
ncbi:DUF485 domain-containing protein [Fictibacillus barbaricus]|uniref:Uncharacterized membrane protein (DUF485 family) n=1 Tax=Fictibacillus barbaricus TaxID=182136 RepID=A0ABU1TYM0_9BACL|nr:DUF485 domain-containing protein [Fictibacillus barbaricus]MDR7072314.1 uncharacterized membrane protein (DUF485 family) [Fictibacillus barbaricus]